MGLAFEIITDEELEEETKDPEIVYEKVSREGMVYCDFCHDYFFPEFHFGDTSDDST